MSTDKGVGFNPIPSMKAALPLIVKRVVASMALASVDRLSLESLLKFSLGLSTQMELPGFAPVVEFLLRLDAEPAEAEEEDGKVRIKKLVTAYVMGAPPRK